MKDAQERTDDRPPILVGLWPLVGRERELDAFDGAHVGSGKAGVVLHGPPGVGKSRLLEEVTAGSAMEAHLERIRATAAASSVPFGAFAGLPPVLSPPAAGRIGLIRELSGALADRAEGRPLVLAVDDAHLLDSGSAALVHHLVTTGAARVVATVRSGEDCPDAIANLWKDGHVGRIELGPLADGESGRLIEALLGAPVDGATARRLVEAAAGNPLYLRELVRAGVEAADLERFGGIWRGSREVRIGALLGELLQERLATVDEEERSALEILALAEPLATGRLTALVGTGPAAALERRGLLQTFTVEHGLQLRLSHPLFGELLRRQMPRLAASSHLAHLAHEFERTGFEAGDLIRVARWRLESGSSAPAGELVEAAARAAAAFDPSLATRFAEAAVASDDGFFARQALGEARMANGEFAAAEDEFAIAAALARDDDEHARNAVARADNLFWRLGETERAIAVIGSAEEAVEARAAADSLAAARATMLLFGGETEAATALAEEMASAADPSLPCAWQAAFTAAWGLTCGGHPDRGVALLDRFLALSVEGVALPPPFSPLLFQANRGTALGFCGRLSEADAEGRAAYQAAVASGARNGGAVAALSIGMAARLRGSIDLAAKMLRESVAELREVDMYRHLTAALGELAQTEALRGDVDAAEAALAEAESARIPTFRMDEWAVGLGRAWVAAARGETSTAIAAATEAAGATGSFGQRTLQALCLHDALRLGAEEAATPLINVCAGVEGELAAAFAAHAEARRDSDGAALLAAAARFSGLGALLFAADATAAASVSFRSQGRGEEAAVAATRAGVLRDRCDSALTPLLAGMTAPDLSPRQREVATLAARGMPSREIAERLVVSVRTVENHLYSVYAKLGISRRSELASALRGNTQG